MRIGIITNSDSVIPLVCTLAANQLQVYLFLSPSADTFINQKIKVFAKQSNVRLKEEIDCKNDVYAWLKKENIDICFIVGYSKLITLNRIQASTPLFNVHFGLLPSFKGPVPVFWQLKSGAEKIGLVIHKVSDRFDDGDIIWKKEISNQSNFNFQSLTQLFSNFCVEGVFFILKMVLNKIPLVEIDKKDTLPSYQKRPALNDVMINWDKMEAKEICNLIRACNPWNKGAISFFKRQELKLMDAIILENEKTLNSEDRGRIVNDIDCLHICCCDGKTIKVNMVYYGDCFIPSYSCKDWGLIKGEKLGS